MLDVIVIPVSPFMQNCRIVAHRFTKKALIIDPGDEKDKIIRELNKRNLTVEAILLTHGHPDHASAVDGIRNHSKCPVYMHKKERPIYESINEWSQQYGLDLPQPGPVDHYVKDGDELELIGSKIRVIFTPGHTPGGTCYFFYKEENPFVLVGDTLFEGSVGRTDLPGGDQKALFASIKNKLYQLDDDVIVMSGHGPDTTIGKEKRSNSFVRAYV